MVSTRLQSNSSGSSSSNSNCGDGSLPSWSEMKGCNKEKEKLISELKSGNKEIEKLLSSETKGCNKEKEKSPITMTARLQSNSLGDSLMPLSIDVNLGKGSYNMGCVTRSGTLVNNQVAVHSKDNQCQSKSNMNLLDLPTEIIQKIVSYLEFKTVSDLRVVSKKMDQICGSWLNLTFHKLQNTISGRFQSIKAQMPRRESARRQHPLACEFDIVETIYMRLNLLHMTFGKHIEKKLIYFFPGEVLDEVYRILYYIEVTPKLPRPYRVTDELFDLTTMAMEHFKEKLEPNLPEITTYRQKGLTNLSSRIKITDDIGILSEDKALGMDFTSITDEESNSSYPPQSNMVLRKRIRLIKQGMKLYNSQLTTMKRELRGYKTKMANQQKTILDYATRLDENDKKNEEMSRKYSTLLQELNKCKTELQYWRSKSPLNPVCGACGTPVATLPIEDLEALSNQGVVIPMVVVQPIDVNNEEAIDKKELAELSPLEPPSETLCSTNSSKEAEKPPQDDEETVKSEGENTNSLEKGRSKPTKRKQISDKQQTYKRQRGILNLRSKTIKIMK